MLAVHFGAGNIGRGFIGSLLYQSGYQTCFVDVNSEIVDLINKKQEYRVVLADHSQEELIIKNVRAINSQKDPHEVIDAIAQADLVTTAVGPNILPHIAGVIAEGLRKRIQTTDQPLNIIACENMIGGSTLLKEKVYEKINEEEIEIFNQRFGFPDAAVDRIVPNQSNEDKLMVMVEPFYEWAVDQTKIVGEKPPVEGITFVDDLKPYIERKLFTVNTGHAVAAYFGYYAGIQTINEAMEREDIKTLVEKTLQETGLLLVKKYNFEMEKHQEYISKIVNRFSNPYISDEVTRVGRSPIRKLGPNDRLISPAKQFAEIVGDQPVYLAKSIAAALLYDYPQDAEAVEIQESIKNNGLELTIEKYTQLDSDSNLAKLIVEQYNSFKGGKL
ncbi:mannitol-1-phosphate 5-dehydrogenase [Bacillus methanolicus]|uniref:Mannitol-1-phosphate 5-dehydrogenase n=1 Tax=Bacillus methanolicus (strain MGA3 / ATCC 53907) TaxID=796606 RepID=I3E3X0_BACMM|nr:mannitol-1-phosphate 5-dehydrogenase [Bacillus methanolicus]AIE58705.1 Mannitol-1-phosphate 5-dehydrogenase [Bacillus methanolicus MGA3]EIJ81191.1 mannitol-1-phosphate 5-dehydrogenase [Bacillus methanolicus MGA3]